MKIFVYEHVTGGGMAGAALPPGLLLEADLMVRSLIDDLSTCPGVTLLTSRDARLTPLPGIETILVGPEANPSAHFERGLEASTAVWPTAPETDGVLQQLSAAVLQRGRILLGSRPEAVKLASSKLATSRALLAAGIPAVATVAQSDHLPATPGRWVTKPDDGAGAEGARMAPDWRHARDRLGADAGLIAQPWIEGDPLSISLLCAEGKSVLLSCNRQIVHLADDGISLTGIDVNAFTDARGEFASLGARVAAAIPGLWGYVGIDLILTRLGPIVLEINPRLTTSYCGLRQALGCSIAARVLKLLEPGALSRRQPSSSGAAVHLTLEARCAQ